MAVRADADIAVSNDKYKKDLDIHVGVKRQKAKSSEAYPARARGAAAGYSGLHQQGHRPAAGHQRLHGARSRVRAAAKNPGQEPRATDRHLPARTAKESEDLTPYI